jgi:hypothetical protein
MLNFGFDYIGFEIDKDYYDMATKRQSLILLGGDRIVCNSDCFNCPYPDCINDELSLEEYKEDINPQEIPDSVKKARARANRYAKKNRVANRERSIKHYYANKEKYNQQAAEWQRENRERTNAMARERYHKNIEYRRQYQREYRARKKAEVS